MITSPEGGPYPLLRGKRVHNGYDEKPFGEKLDQN